MNTSKLAITKEKHKHIFILYTLLLKKRGKEERFRSWFYQEVGRFFYTDKWTVAKIISEMQREHYSPSQTDMDDFFEQLGEFVEIAGI